MTTLKQIIELNNYYIEIHHNDLVKNKPYLIRIFNYEIDPIEIRATAQELNDFINYIGENAKVDS